MISLSKRRTARSVLLFTVCAFLCVPGCCLFKKEGKPNPFDGPAPIPAESPNLHEQGACPTSACPTSAAPIMTEPITSSPVSASPAQSCPSSNCPAQTYPPRQSLAPIQQPVPVTEHTPTAGPSSVSVIIPDQETVPGGSVTNSSPTAKEAVAAKEAESDSSDSSDSAVASDAPESSIRPVGAQEGEASISNGSYLAPSEDAKDELLSDPQSAPQPLEKSDLPSGYNDYSALPTDDPSYQNVSRPVDKSPESSDTEERSKDTSMNRTSEIPTTGAVEIPVYRHPAAGKTGSLGLPATSNRAQFRTVAR